MRIVTDFPHRVRAIEHVFIPLSDGVRLAARLWLPEGTDTSPVPAILEYIPYRKRDRTRERDEPMHYYFAGHGYAAVRVDLRGTGDSEGLLGDEYEEQELQDAVEVIRWIACQSWCTGKVGMIGKSWGGFNALQVAALEPHELGAVISVCASDDRYADDAHYMGGCLLNENLIWGSTLFTLNALPPDPELVPDWRRLWLERLEHNPLFAEIWLQHQRRDDYWKSASVSESYERITCAVYAVGGWADGYTNAVPRLLSGLRCPRKGLVGPWAHVYPHTGVPAPAIGFLQEALRWWDCWLKGIDDGIATEPVYRVWMQEAVAPMAFYDERPGRWVSEDRWPSPRIAAVPYRLEPGSLVEPTGAGSKTRLTLRSPQTVGLAAGSWCPFGVEGEMPRDQREDDGKSLVFDSAPLGAPLEILGAPVLRLELESDRPAAMAAARLNDLAPDGSSTRVSYGLFNLTHRDGHETPEPLEPGRRYRISFPLNDVAHQFAPGHRIRLALSTSYWPIAWPSPEPTTLTIITGASRLELPVRPPRPDDEKLRPFAPPESGPEAETTDLAPGGTTRTVTRELGSNEIVYTVTTDLLLGGQPTLTRIDPLGLDFGHGTMERFRISEDDPLSANAEILHHAVLARGEWSIRIETRTRLTSSLHRFFIQAELDAFEGDACVFSRSWDRSVPRDLV